LLIAAVTVCQEFNYINVSSEYYETYSAVTEFTSDPAADLIIS